MKRLARIIGIVGGVAALMWAMRDRFISVAISREPEPPAFKSVESNGGLLTVDGIGPVYAERLEGVGIGDLAALSDASPDSVAEACAVSVARARAWIDQAAKLTR